MGEFTALSLTLGRAVARSFCLKPARRTRGGAYNEVRIARQVTSQRVPRHDVGQAEGHSLPMEFVDSGDLGLAAPPPGRLPVDKASRPGLTCAGLAAAHEKGAPPRPRNQCDDRWPWADHHGLRLAGLAEQLQGDIRSGTPAYMAPEQLAGPRSRSGRHLHARFAALRVFTGKRRVQAASLIELCRCGTGRIDQHHRRGAGPDPRWSA
jgi:hypothetical protein